MPTVIRLARTTEEVNSVLEVRYKIIEQSGRSTDRHFRVTRKVIDHFDVYPSTMNLFAHSNGATVGCLRCVPYSATEPMLNAVFSFGETHANLKGRSSMVDLFGVLNEHPTTVLLWKNMIETLVSLLGQRDQQNLFLLCPEHLMKEAGQIGFHGLGDPIEAPGQSYKVVPCTIDVGAYYQRWLLGIKDQEIVRFQEVFYKIVFNPGEILVAEGESGSTAYLIEDGEVEVIIRKGDQLVPISSIGPGNLIGEIAIVTNEPRTASILAKQRTVCMGFDRADFLRIMYQEPHRSMDIFRIFSKRITESNRKLAELRSKNDVGLFGPL